MTLNKPRQFTGRWFRHYEDTLNDPKIIALTNKQHRFLMNCWELASKNEGFLPPVDQLAKLLRLRSKEVPVLVAALRAGEEPLLDEIDGKLTPHNWNGRQFKSDHSAARMRKFRRKTDAVLTQNCTDFSSKFTSEIPTSNSKQTKSRLNGDGHVTATVTAPDTDTDTDTEVNIPTVVDTPPSSTNQQAKNQNREVCVPPSGRNGARTLPDLFSVYWEMFVRAGKALNDRDKEQTLRVWLNYQPAEHEKIVFWTADQLRDRWSDEKHTPLPVNNLKGEGWKRISEPRSIRGPEASSERRMLSMLQASMAARGYK
jgi:hypothetical protein